MARRKKPNHITRKDWDEVDSPPLTREQLEEMKPLRDVFPELAEYAVDRKRGQRGRQKSPTKKPVTIRIDPEVLNIYKATGSGWQSRMNEVLKRGAKTL